MGIYSREKHQQLFPLYGKILIGAAWNFTPAFCPTTFPVPMRHTVNGSKAMEKECDRPTLAVWSLLEALQHLKAQLELATAKQPFIVHSQPALSPLWFGLSIQFSSAAFTGLTFDVLPKQATMVKIMLIIKKHTHVLSLSLFYSHSLLLSPSLSRLPGLKKIPTEQMNNIHDSTASIQRVTVVLLCPPELLVALVKISSLLLQPFGSSSPRVPIILEGNIYLTLLRLFPFLFLLSTRCLISLLSLCIIHRLFLLVRNYI